MTSEKKESLTLDDKRASVLYNPYDDTMLDVSLMPKLKAMENNKKLQELLKKHGLEL